MIKFNYVEAKNFLSIGNTPVRFDLNKYSRTLINGENGAGKSTQLDAIVYALFNKPIRDVKLGQLVNSVNNKKMLTVVNFDINSVNYEVHRGQKPTVFKVFVNSEPLNEDAAAKDLQAKLEKDILKCNYKTFSQVVIMSSTNFTYFMELSAADRRSVVEAMLDIEVIGEMSTLMKERVKEVKHRQESNETKLMQCKTNLAAQQTIVDNLSTVSEDQINDLEQQKNKTYEELENLENQLELETNTEVMLPQCPEKPPEPILGIIELPDEPTYPDKPKMPPEPSESVIKLPEEPQKVDSEQISELMNRKQDLITKQQYLIHQAKTEKDTAAFYKDNDSCDRCNQPIDHEFKTNVINKTNTKLSDLGTEHNNISKLIESLNTELAELEQIQSVYNEYENECTNLTNAHRLQRQQELSDHRLECQRINNDYETKVNSISAEYQSECNRIKSNVEDSNNHTLYVYRTECDKIQTTHQYECDKIRQEHKTKVNNLQISVNDLKGRVSSLNAQIGNLRDKQNNNAQRHYDELETLNKELTELMKHSAQIKEEVELCALGTEMLKDTGLKSKIVQQYLPTINKSINEFLDLMGANYSFVLDESFNETIKSRYRDKFSYGSFSNGERSRINFSIMLMWKKLSESKNTVSSNLLFIDEILDSSLDKDGIGSIMNIFDSMQGNNIFVISHRKEIQDHFDAYISVKKIGNYSDYEFG